MKTAASLLLCTFALIGSLAAQTAVSTNKTSYLVLDPIVITFSGLSGDSGDYIAITLASAADDVWNQFWWSHVGGQVSGTVTVPTDASYVPGTYEARVHLHNNDNVVSARSRFTISYPNSTVSTDKTSYFVLQPITVTYSNAPGYTDDYITIVPASASDDTYWEYYKTGGNKNGTMKFTNPLDPGTYEARLHFDNNDNVVSARAKFTISYPTPTVSTSKSNYAVSEPVVVNYSNMAGYAGDYITVVPANSSDDTYWEYYRTGGKTSGSMTFSNKLDAGTYQARVHFNNNDAVVSARAAFTVGGSLCSVTLTPSTATAPVGVFAGKFDVAAASGCAWTAVSNVTWITIGSGSPGSGNGTVNYTVSANSALTNVPSPRTGTITVNDKTFPVTQDGGTSGSAPPAAGNLIQNWDAEAGPASPDCSGLASIPGWTTDGNVTVCAYGNGGYPAPTDPGPANRGKQFFAGGNVDSSKLTQSIDLSASAAAIDTGSQPFTLDGWLGGYSSQDDNAVLRVTFRGSAGGSSLGTANIGPVTATDRNSATGLWERATTGKVPAGSRIAELSLELTRVEGTANDGYADNLYFGLTAGMPTTGGKCGGTCRLSAYGQVMAAAGGTGSFTVTADATWDAVAVDSWIQIASGSSGNGNGTVNFTVSANTGAPRSGTISAGGFTYTIHQNGTPSGTTTGCSYLIQGGTVQSVPVTGTTSGMITVVTNQTCNWTATTAASWITIRNGASATGNGAVAYTVPVNDTGLPRSGAIVIAGQMVAIVQDGGAPPGTPGVSAGGIVNTASYAPGGPPYGSLAQGSFFSIYGSDLGPDQFYQADPSSPVPKTLGGVSIQITQGTAKYDAYILFASKGQINAILPSTVPVGGAQVVVSYNGKTSSPANITVAKTSLGVFFQQVNGKNMAIAQNVASATSYPLNLPDTPAKPGQIVILWGTGMGAVNVPDNLPPGPVGDMANVPVTITVGGIAAPRLYAGRAPQFPAVDNIYFTVPNGVPYGCQVPVAITAGGVAANTANIAISADGSKCQ